jgi:hypothetical protein
LGGVLFLSTPVEDGGMFAAIFLGLLGGFAYRLINLNPGFRFTRLGISWRDLLWAVGVNAFLGGLAGFLGWAFGGAALQPPKSYGVFVLCGVGGGSIIQSWAMAFANIRSRELLDRAADTVEVLSRGETSPQGERLRHLSDSLRSSTGYREQERITREMLQLASVIAPRSIR